MTNTIRETIESVVSVPSGYERYLDDAVDALTVREQQVGQALVDYASAFLPEDDAIEVLRNAGLEYTKPEPVRTPDTQDSAPTGLAAVAEALEAALEALRSIR